MCVYSESSKEWFRSSLQLLAITKGRQRRSLDERRVGMRRVGKVDGEVDQSALCGVPMRGSRRWCRRQGVEAAGADVVFVGADGGGPAESGVAGSRWSVRMGDGPAVGGLSFEMSVGRCSRTNVRSSFPRRLNRWRRRRWCQVEVTISS